MGKVSIAHTAAFELCEEGTCAKEKVSSDKRDVFCKQGDGCSKGGCYCQLFRRPVDAKDDDLWIVVPLNAHHEAKYEPTKYQYQCICVRPILETTHSEGGIDYTTRFQICEEGTGLCTLDRPGGVPDLVGCTGDCTKKECKCTLFQLSMGGDPGNAKWKLAAGGAKMINHQNGQYYRCFCLK